MVLTFPLWVLPLLWVIWMLHKSPLVGNQWCMIHQFHAVVFLQRNGHPQPQHHVVVCLYYIAHFHLIWIWQIQPIFITCFSDRSLSDSSKSWPNPCNVSIKITNCMCSSTFTRWFSLSCCTSTYTQEIKSWSTLPDFKLFNAFANVPPICVIVEVIKAWTRSMITLPPLVGCPTILLVVPVLLRFECQNTGVSEKFNIIILFVWLIVT